MARRSREVGTITSLVLGAALAAGVAMPAQAGDNTLALSGSAAFTTDYVFRGITQTAENPAAQAEFDATYGMFYAGIWGSNLDFGGVFGTDIASLEIDYYAGITPMWKGITFNIGGIYYTYPGAFDPGAELDYFELKTGASYTFNDKLTVGVTNYWSPEFSGKTGDADALELSAGYAFAGKLFNFFSPSISGLIGWQWVDKLDDYTYWNVGLTLGFMDHWSADVRYWDTGSLNCPNSGVGACDGRVVGTVKATF
jgi:uncharacterized protein (TIGR02001 family)